MMNYTIITCYKNIFDHYLNIFVAPPSNKLMMNYTIITC